MQTLTIKASKIKCGGCAANIKKGLAELGDIEVDVASGEVTIQGENLERTAIAAQLAALGYPEAQD